jgi:hypothetical protein
LRGCAVRMNQLRIKQKLVVVPHDAWAVEFAQDLDDGIRSWPQGRHIAKTDDLIHTSSADLREHGSQRHLICMDIGDQGDARHRNDSDDFSRRALLDGSAVAQQPRQKFAAER